MRRIRNTLVIALMLLPGLGVFAQDGKKFAFGLGPEWNMNSRSFFAAGAVLTGDYALPVSIPFSAGLTVTASTNFAGFTVIEPEATFRWYFLGGDHSGWFVQAEGGVFLCMEDGELSPMVLGGLRGGIRLPLTTQFYIEPYGRLGYPFAFGIGVIAGIRLPN